ncbi:MAG: extracellular solute-binding protein [Candidatus Wallbacteria bacterium]|nr:extracellular solute-binding protein [Candidatus Wallbacteria bacterium]
MKNLLTILFCLLWAGLCSAGEITVWAMGAEGKLISAMTADFEKEYPDIRVKTQSIPWTGAHEKIVTSVVGGIPPDVCQMGTTWMSELNSMNALERLDDYLKASKTTVLENFFPGSLESCRRTDGVYGVPWTVDTRVYFYREDLFQKAGISNFPKTWDELSQATDAILSYKKQNNLPGYAISLPINDWQPYLLFLWQNGGSIMETGDTICRLDGPEAIEALSFYKSFFEKGATPRESAKDMDLFNAFESCYYPMFISGPWMVSEISRNKPGIDGLWKTAPMPVKKDHTSFIGGCNLVIFKDSKHKADAWKFIDFLSRPEVQAKWYAVSRNLPASIPAWEDQNIKSNGLLQAFREQLNCTKSPPAIPEWERIASLISQTMEKVIYDKQSAGEALHDASVSVNKMLSDRPAEQSTGFKTFLVSILSALLFGSAFFYLKPRLGETPGSKQAWIFLFPAIAILTIFLFIPLAASFIMSLTNWNVSAVNNPGRVVFIGLQNYIALFSDPVFWISLRNTLLFAVTGVPLNIITALIMAVAINQGVVRLKPFFRTSLFLPVITTMVAVAVVWRWLYNEEYGIFNWFCGLLGFGPFHWLSGPALALFSLIMMSVWKGFGYNMIIFIAALQSIPTEIYEAADIDGASRLQQFFRITLPMLSRTMVFVLVMTTIGYLQFFTEPYVMTEGGPLNSTMSVVLYMYNHGFKFYNLGYASSVAYVLCALICAFTVLQFKFSKKNDW